ncbi:hypothetical protein BDZ97DRAFT_1668870, partial [Flammula alnicola]
LHIDFAKHGWRASNQRDEFPQMIRWLSRQEKIASFETHQKQSQSREKTILKPFRSSHRVHDNEEEKDLVKALPRSAKNPCGRFDTVIAIVKDEAESTGVAGTRIGRVRVIFTLPKQLETSLGRRPAPTNWPQGPLAYIEWYSKLDAIAEVKHGMMYRLKKVSTTTDQTRVQGAVLPLSNIRQSCMLFPVFPEDVPIQWTPANVLDHATSFLLNNWLSKYSYQTIW